MTVGAPSLLTQLRVAIRVRHYSPRTEEAYVQWVRRFIRFCGTRHPRELGAGDVTRFLSSLAMDANVSASTQNQALAAIVFLYRDVLNMPVGWLNALVRAKRPARVPVVLTRDEVRQLFAQLCGGDAARLVLEVLYGTGMRLLEALRLRVKDIDFGANEITVRGGKGDRDRRTMLPDRLKSRLLKHLAEVRVQHERDLASGAGGVELPGALSLKYPNAGREWAWQWVFPAGRMYEDAETGQRPPPHARDGGPARVQGSAPGERDSEECELSHPAALVCDPSPRDGIRYPHGSGAVGPSQRGDHDDLHARAESRGVGCAKPGRHAVINRLG